MNKKKLIILISVIITLAILVCVGIFAMSGNKADRVVEQLDLGEKYLEELEYEKALAAYKEVLQIDPKSVEAYLGMAEVYIAMGDYEEALSILEEGYSETNDAKLTAKKSEVDTLITEAQATPVPTEEPAEASIADDFVIDWKDANLEAAMREVTGIYDRDIVYGDVKDMTELYLDKDGATEDAAKIKDISALRYLTNLKCLSMSFNSISDISVLGELNNLEELWLAFNPIGDISVLSKLTNLSYLNINAIGIGDISVVGTLTNLKQLHAGGNEITDVSALGEMTNLEYLYLYTNLITDVNALGNLPNLKTLFLEDNPITDFSPVLHVPELYYWPGGTTY